jgi:hypothetical protein
MTGACRDGTVVASESVTPLIGLHATMLTLATLRRSLYALMSARFIELQKQKRRP